VLLVLGMFGALDPAVRCGDAFAVADTVQCRFDGENFRTPAVERRLRHSAAENEALAVLPPCRLVSLPDDAPFVTAAQYACGPLLAALGVDASDAESRGDFLHVD